MKNKDFKPYHINATTEDLTGNDGIGRYILLPGSNGRAEKMAENFTNLKVKTHPRGHHLYLGTLNANGHSIDIASISSGMGCPSMEIILHELFHLGGKRFLRVGSAGSLQEKLVKLGDIVVATATVRDETTTNDYMPPAVPAIAALEFVNAINTATNKLKLQHMVLPGIVHCKSSFYAREFGAGPKAKENHAYLDLLAQCGVLASEMESAALFIQSQLYNFQLMQQGNEPHNKVLAGAILAIYSMLPDIFISPEQEAKTLEHLVELAFASVKTLASNEKNS